MSPIELSWTAKKSSWTNQGWDTSFSHTNLGTELHGPLQKYIQTRFLARFRKRRDVYYKLSYVVMTTSIYSNSNVSALERLVELIMASHRSQNTISTDPKLLKWQLEVR